MISVHVPAMTSRQDVRAVSARISDVPGVRTLRVDLASHTVRVTGLADPAAVAAAIGTAGYAADAVHGSGSSGPALPDSGPTGPVDPPPPPPTQEDVP